jgi:hypothetical protein
LENTVTSSATFIFGMIILKFLVHSVLIYFRMTLKILLGKIMFERKEGGCVFVRLWSCRFSLVIRQILENKREYNEAVHRLFIDLKKAYESVGREVLYNRGVLISP